MRTRHLTALPIAAVLAVTLAACGSDDDATPDAPSGGSSVASPAVSSEQPAPDGANEASLGEADVEFAQGMIAHHEQAIEMAEIALDPSREAGPQVVDLATRVQAAQEPEIDRMTAWLTAAGEPLTMDMSDGHDMSSMEGMMSVEQMDALATATGDEFDRMWLEMMIEHHEGAISQSEAVLADGSNPDVRALAEEIITAQQGEIEEMQALLAG